ncbi:MAG: hypothetical protein Q8Q59_07720 [Luteolibacter sp.]|jgi:hypothetical protein|nr:hypothetical protein [Luteolibacter sp.]
MSQALRDTGEAFARFIEDGEADPVRIATAAKLPLPASLGEECARDLRRITVEAHQAFRESLANPQAHFFGGPTAGRCQKITTWEGTRAENM